jgi:hypothetical protein
MVSKTAPEAANNRERWIELFIYQWIASKRTFGEQLASVMPRVRPQD